MKNKVSIVVVTKNRSDELVHCLASLAAQAEKVDEVVIVDNNSTDLTPQIVKSFQSNVIFPVKYVKEKKNGFPVIYNKGLNVATHQWVAFIDDDCVADPNWLGALKQTIQKSHSVTAILGLTTTYYCQNIYSLATQIFYSIWQENGKNKDHIYKLEILDNKNIAYNTSSLHDLKVRYDESRIKIFNGASEDCDLGLQIQENGGAAVFCAQMKAQHKDPITFQHYFNKLFFNVASSYALKKQWQGKDNKLNKRFKEPKKKTFWKMFGDTVKEQNLSAVAATFLFLVCIFTIIIFKVSPLYLAVSSHD